MNFYCVTGGGAAKRPSGTGRGGGNLFCPDAQD